MRVCRRHDFIEGVRALIVDKTNDPRWNPRDPVSVTDTLLDEIFAPFRVRGMVALSGGPRMADYETILVERHDAVTLVRLNRPQALNALNSQVLGEMVAAAAAL